MYIKALFFVFLAPGWLWAAESGISVGLQLSRFEYEEPNVMTEKGELTGAYLAYVSSNLGGWNYRMQLDYLQGRLNYDGGIYDTSTGITTPATSQTSDDVLIGQLDFGLGDGGIQLRPYAGLAYRLWRDEIDGDSGYRRHTSYVYLPLGFSVGTSFNSSAEIIFEAQYHFWIQGKNKSYLTDINPSFGDYEFKQSEGSGYQLALLVNFTGTSSFFPFLRLMYQTWKVANSEYKYFPVTGNYLVEPENNTSVLTLTAGLRF